MGGEESIIRFTRRNTIDTHVGRVSWVGRLERPRDLDGRARGRAAAARHLDLRAADVELGRAARVVDGQRLDPQQVLAVLDALGDGVLVRVFLRALSLLV